MVGDRNSDRPMTIIVDTHVHIYPCYDYAAAIRSAVANLSRLAGEGSDALKAVMLTERSDCSFWKNLSERGPVELGSGFAVEKVEDGGSIFIRHIPTNEDLLVFPGRQIVTSEKVEVLSVLSGTVVPDGLPVRETLARVVDAGALAVLCWGFGKWTGIRGHLVRKVIEDFSSRCVFTGDTPLRCRPIPEPDIFRIGRARGHMTLAGSDPLPVAGEESMIGTYGVIVRETIGSDCPAAGLRMALLKQGCDMVTAGTRGPFHRSLYRYLRNELNGRLRVCLGGKRLDHAVF